MNFVHIAKEESPMNTVVTSRQDILKAARRLASDMSMSLIGIRQVADACNIAVGSVYNYFPSKAELLAALTEDIWVSAFGGSLSGPGSIGFVDHVAWLFERARAATAEFPSFLSTHNVHFRSGEKKTGRSAMDRVFEGLRQGLLDSLKLDPRITDHAFDGGLTYEELAEFAFINLYHLLSSGSDNCSTLLKVLSRVAYGR